MSNLGLWAAWHHGLDGPEPYGLTETYQLGVDYLADCARVEDWGCGKGWMRSLIDQDRYVGVDGSPSAFADVVVDLAEYRSRVPGVFMRHVLEHDYRWREILENAVASFTERLVVVLFTPLVDATVEVAFNDDPGVPDLAFSLADITACFEGLEWSHTTLESSTHYGTETIFYVERCCPDSVA